MRPKPHEHSDDLPEDPGRRRLIAGLMAMGLGTIIGGCTVGEKPKNFSAVQASATPSPEVQLDRVEGSFTLGNYTFEFAPEFTAAEIQRVRTILERAHPVVTRYVPAHASASGTVTVTREKGNVSWTERNKLAIGFDPKSGAMHEDVLIHEYTHLLKGDARMGQGFVEEGIAAAVEQLTSDEICSPESIGKIQFQISPTVERTIGIDPQIYFDQDHPLSQLRYKYSAALWMKLERSFPGFIKSFVSNCYERLEQGKGIASLSESDILSIMRTINPGSVEIAKNDPALNFKRRQRVGNVLFGYFEKSKGSGGVLNVGLMRRFKDSTEQVVPNKEVNVVIKSGMGRIGTFSFRTGNSWLESCTTFRQEELAHGFGTAKQFTATIKCEGVIETFNFTIPD